MAGKLPRLDLLQATPGILRGLITELSEAFRFILYRQVASPLPDNALSRYVAALIRARCVNA